MLFSNGLGELGLGELGLGEMGLGEMGGHQVWHMVSLELFAIKLSFSLHQNVQQRLLFTKYKPKFMYLC